MARSSPSAEDRTSGQLRSSPPSPSVVPLTDLGTFPAKVSLVKNALASRNLSEESFSERKLFLVKARDVGVVVEMENGEVRRPAASAKVLAEYRDGTRPEDFTRSKQNDRERTVTKLIYTRPVGAAIDEGNLLRAIDWLGFVSRGEALRKHYSPQQLQIMSRIGAHGQVPLKDLALDPELMLSMSPNTYYSQIAKLGKMGEIELTYHQDFRSKQARLTDPILEAAFWMREHARTTPLPDQVSKFVSLVPRINEFREQLSSKCNELRPYLSEADQRMFL